MTLKTYYEEETFKNQLRLLNILLDTNKKLEKISIALEENKKSDEGGK
tara:strand:+ start:50 stop:193 length:144 start_codon:yes stop_codon:yes gene_type:complete